MMPPWNASKQINPKEKSVTRSWGLGCRSRFWSPSLRFFRCTAEENKMISLNDTWQGFGHGGWHKKHHHKRQNSSESDEFEETNAVESHQENSHEHHGHGRHGHGFFRFIKTVFGQSGEWTPASLIHTFPGRDFSKCMRKCFHHKRQNHECLKQKKYVYQ